MGKQVLGEIELPEEGDIIDHIIEEEKRREKATAPLRTNEKIEELKRRVDIIRLFASFGVCLKPRGKRHEGLCPWHTDKDPSLSVDREKGLYHCFGCGEKGDVITLVEKMKGYTFREALSYLKKEGGGEPDERGRLAGAKARVALPLLLPSPPPKEEREEKAAPITLSLRKVAEYYHKKLYENQEALSYLAKRGFNKSELFSSLLLGYSDGSLLAKLSESEKKRLMESGIIKKNENTGKLYEHFYNCITFPQFDEKNEVVGFYGRRIDK
jgi:DNA primase